MEKRVLLAVALSFVVLYGYQAMFPPPKPPQRTPASSQAASTPATSTADPAPQSVAPGPPAPQLEAPAAPAAPAAARVVADMDEREIVVEIDSVRAVFTTRGGALKSWRLKKYQDAAKLDPIYKKIQAILAEDCPNVWLGFVGVSNAWRADIKNFKPNTGLTIWTRDVQFG